MSTSPPGSHLILLNDLVKIPEGTKVRFLGCVVSYNLATGRLELEHHVSAAVTEDTAGPAAETPAPAPAAVKASVDTALVRETLKERSTAIGTWVNVIGYVERLPPTRRRQQQQQQQSSAAATAVVKVQAVMLWEAPGTVDLQRYERAVVGRMEMRKVRTEEEE